MDGIKVETTIPPALNERLTERANELGVSVADIVRFGISISLNFLGREIVSGAPTSDPACGADLVKENYEGILREQAEYEISRELSEKYDSVMDVEA